MKNKSALLLTSIFLITTNCFAKISLPAVISDNMVLQQKSEVAIWGWGDPNEKIGITGSWNIKDTVYVTANNNSFWKTKIKTDKAGGPYTLEILGSSKIVIKNILLGEVWICSGQSNMELNVNQGIKDGEEEAKNANYPQIRIFHVQKIAEDYPQRNLQGYWTECTPASMRTTSALAYFFGRELSQKMNFPVGLIVSAWGGTAAEVWVKKEIIETDPVLKEASDKIVEKPWWPNKPGVAYNGMIAPIVPYGIAGTIWYQGESNVPTAETYCSVFRKLIESWREDFGYQFPFYYVQIAPYQYGQVKKASILREQQVKALEIPNTGMVVISDLVDNVRNIHPLNKQDVGKRLANLALAEKYGLTGISYKSPAYKSMKIEKGKIRIFFNNADNGLVCNGKDITYFKIAGADHKFSDASVKIENNTVLVFNKDIKDPAAVRYAFDEVVITNLFNKEGLPVSSFRTDNWDDN
jgi:sialate O-acetylesterase